MSSKEQNLNFCTWQSVDWKVSPIKTIFNGQAANTSGYRDIGTSIPVIYESDKANCQKVLP